MDWDRISVELSKKLDPANVKPAKTYGPKGDYIEGWHAMAEANRIFGFGEWDYILKDVKCVSERPRKIGKEPNTKDGWGVSYIASVTVLVGQAKREDVGAGHGYDVDCGLAHESAIKEAVTDALKRALRSFGNPFGLALYDKSRENVGAPEAPAYAPDADIALIQGAKTGTELYEIVKAIGDRDSLPAIAATIVDRLRVLVSAAQSTVALEAFERVFGKEWPLVRDDAMRRRNELTQEKDAA